MSDGGEARDLQAPFGLSAVDGQAMRWLHFDYAQCERMLVSLAHLSTSLGPNGHRLAGGPQA